jgi:hypothetical protein
LVNFALVSATVAGFAVVFGAKKTEKKFCQRFDESKVDVENVNATKRALRARETE